MSEDLINKAPLHFWGTSQAEEAIGMNSAVLMFCVPHPHITIAELVLFFFVLDYLRIQEGPCGLYKTIVPDPESQIEQCCSLE